MDQRNMSDTFTCRGPPVSWGRGVESRSEPAPHLWSSHWKMTKNVNLMYEQRCSSSMFRAWFSRPVISEHTCQGWKVQVSAQECIYRYPTYHKVVYFFPTEESCMPKQKYIQSCTDWHVCVNSNKVPINIYKRWFRSDDLPADPLSATLWFYGLQMLLFW